jgi:hypothetical protein
MIRLVERHSAHSWIAYILVRLGIHLYVKWSARVFWSQVSPSDLPLIDSPLMAAIWFECARWNRGKRIVLEPRSHLRVPASGTRLGVLRFLANWPLSVVASENDETETGPASVVATAKYNLGRVPSVKVL